MGSISKDFFLGLRAYFKSFGFIAKHRLWYYYLYPLVFILIFSLSAFFGISWIVDTIAPRVNDMLGLESVEADGFWDRIALFFREAGRYLIHAVVWVSLMFIYYKVNKYFVLIVMSPVMALLSERTDAILSGTAPPFSLTQFLKDIWRGILIALRNGVLELFFTVLILLVNLGISLLFPPLTFISSPLSSILIFFLGAYYYGFATMDYNTERYRMKMGQSVQLIRKNSGIALANGTVFTLWLIVPIFGTYIGTVIAPITCTVGATLAMHEKGLLKNQEAGLTQP